MATTLTINSIKAMISYKFASTNTVGVTDVSSGSVVYSTALTNGTGANLTADLIYAKRYTIAASGNQAIDLAGSVTDTFGNTITMARVKFIYVHHRNTTTATDVSFGNATNPLANWISTATVTVKILNNGIFLLGSPNATGYAVTGGSADAVKILNNDGSNSATVDVIIIGSTA